MMEELIAKRYVKALKSVMNKEELKYALELFELISELYKDEKIKSVLFSPEIKEEKKAELLLESLKIEDKKLINLIKLLAQKRRLSLFSYLAKELRYELAVMNKEFEGCVHSDFELSDEEIKAIEEALSKRISGHIKLRQCSKDYDGIKVEVEGIGLEIDFSRSRIQKQIIDNILKAI